MHYYLNQLECMLYLILQIFHDLKLCKVFPPTLEWYFHPFSVVNFTNYLDQLLDYCCRISFKIILFDRKKKTRG